MQTYTIDTDQTTLSYTVRRILRRQGRFTRLAGAVTVDGEGRPRSLEAAVDTRSLRTAQPAQDRHLTSASFLDARRYPIATYRSLAITRTGPDHYAIQGLLRLHGQEHSVALQAELAPLDELDGTQRVRVTGTLHRADFGIPSSPLLRTLLWWMIGDTVVSTAEVRLTPALDGASRDRETVLESRS